jgi:hypothetical protein
LTCFGFGFSFTGWGLGGGWVICGFIEVVPPAPPLAWPDPVVRQMASTVTTRRGRGASKDHHSALARSKPCNATEARITALQDFQPLSDSHTCVVIAGR